MTSITVALLKLSAVASILPEIEILSLLFLLPAMIVYLVTCMLLNVASDNEL